MNKLFVLAFVVLAVVYAADEKKDAADNAERPKTFKRLIPADVLRGKRYSVFYMKVNGVQGFEMP